MKRSPAAVTAMKQALKAALLLAALRAARAGSRGANGVAVCGDLVAVADSAVDAVVLMDPRATFVVDVVPQDAVLEREVRRRSQRQVAHDQPVGLAPRLVH